MAADLAKVAVGDIQALERVYAATSAKLYGICLRILRDEGEAEDALQDIYLTVWRRAGAFDDARGTSPITWLAALARNRAIDHLRASKAHLFRPVETLADRADGMPLASELLESRQAAKALNACLEELEPAHAACVRAAFFDGRTYPELAQAQGTPLGTVKSWIRRALHRLKDCLER